MLGVVSVRGSSYCNVFIYFFTQVIYIKYLFLYVYSFLLRYKLPKNTYVCFHFK